ncbi:MAG TPA: homoserine dehydrogenase [Acidobacteriota bacterium]
MSAASIVLLGFGQVGRAFLRLFLERRERLRERYDIELNLRAVLTSRGGLMTKGALHDRALGEMKREELPGSAYWKPNLGLDDIWDKVERGILVECLSGDLETGQPALGYIRSALARGWQVAASSKGPLAVDMKGLRAMARRWGVHFKFSAATGAALPAADVVLMSLAGSEITALEGILNGTTNFILTRMGEGLAYPQALAEAKLRGIAEPDPRWDVEGWDTAVKLLILANLILDSDFKLSDVRRTGITDLSLDEVDRVGREGRKVKLLGRLETKSGRPSLAVAPTQLEPGHPLFPVDGPEKGVTFTSDTMGSLTVIGGRSDPRGAAAALLKDIVVLASPFL